MRKILNEKTVGRIFNFLAMVMFLLLLHYCLELTGINRALDDEHIYFKKESILLNILKLACSAVVLYFVGMLSSFLTLKSRRNILLTIACTIAAGISFYWVMNTGTMPGADQQIVAGFADVFSDGDFYGIQKGGYIAVYPQQLGLVTLLRLLFSVFGRGNYLAFQLFAAAMVPVTVFAGCMVVRELSDDNARVELYYLLFAVTCFPMYAYSSFVYGDLVSIPFVLLAIWALLSCIKRFRIWKLAGMGVSIGIAVTLRINVIIVVIAMLIVALVKFIFERNRRMLVMGIVIVVGSLAFQLAVRGIYASEWGEDADAMPPLCYIAMGLNDDNSYPGWYNIYSMHFFATSDYDVDLANERALASIKEYVGKYKNNPEYMIDFFTRKMNAQWNAPMYQGIVMNNRIVGRQSGLISDIYYGGEVGGFLEKFTKLYQLLVYGSIVFLLISKRKQWDQIEKYVLLIAVFGGFLFSLIWEAKTRYVFPYLLMELPYVALGINEVAARLQSRRKTDTVRTGRWSKSRFLTGYIVILFLHIVLGVVFGIQKDGFHEDEYYTLATGSGRADIAPHGYQWRSGEELQSCFFVRSDNRFAFDEVLQEQAENAQPPLYYFILNIFMSLFAGRFYKWFGILLNLMFSAVTLCGIFFLFNRIDTGKNRYWLSLLAGAVYAFAPSTISSVVLIRMYAMSAMWIVLYACVLMELYRSGECGRKKFAVLTVCGAFICYLSFLTHSFCLLEVFFLTLFYAVYIVAVKRKGFVRLLIYGAAILGSAGLAVLTFPASLRQEGVFTRTRDLLSYIDEYVFGGAMLLAVPVTLAALLFMTVLFIRRSSREKVCFDLGGYAILLAATVATGLTVGDIYREFSLTVAALLLPLMAYITAKALNVLADTPKAKLSCTLNCLTVVLVFIPILIGHAKDNILFLYTDEAAKIVLSEYYKEYPCIVVYGESFEHRTWYAVDYDQLWPFRQILYVDHAQLMSDMEEHGEMMSGDNKTLADAEKVVIYVDGTEEVVQKILENNTHLERYTMLRQDSVFRVYLLE